MKKIAVFASGTGSNAARIIEHFRHHGIATVALIVCNNPVAGITRIAANENIPVLLLEKERFSRGDAYVNELIHQGIELIVLAGFLWKLPPVLVRAFPQRIINIHPALLPKYGGKGMYGKYVHETVIGNKEKESGITIHYVDEVYDNGEIIFQATCPVLENDTPDSLAQRIQLLEHTWYPRIIERLL